ncbi:MAG TPA: hypothetical protein VF260_11050 [Bacilli bacterium]
MGVRFNREYADIVDELTAAIAQIADCHTAFEMSQSEWEELAEQEQKDTLRTLADDVFYALGAAPKMQVGSGKIEYDAGNHAIKVFADPQLVIVVKLV